MVIASCSPLRPTFVAYLRVSTTRQGVSGLGLEAQRSTVEGYVTQVGGHLLEEFVEVESGKVRDRPILHRALARCRSTGAVLVIAKLDRLARNVAFVSSLMEAKTEFVACDMPFANRLLVHVIAAFAEHERDLIAARTRAALAAAKAKGVRLGTYGAVLAERRKAEASEHAQGLQSILAPLASQGLTLKALAGHLNGLGILTREGAAWCPTTVRRVLIRLDLHSAPNIAVKAATGSSRLEFVGRHPIPREGGTAALDGLCG